MKKQFYTVCLIIAASGVCAQSGIGTVSPNSTLDVRGAMAGSLRTVSTSTTVDYSDQIVVFTGTSDATVTLPDATACTGRIYWIKNAGSTAPVAVLTVNPIASQTVDGAATATLDEPFETIRLVSDGSNWQITSQDVPTAKSTTTGGSWNEGGNALKTSKAVGTGTNYDFPFITNSVEIMRLTTGGWLGIGTNNPEGRIHCVNEAGDPGNQYAFNDYMNGTTITQGFLQKKSAGTLASPANLSNGDTIGQFRFVPRFNGAIDHSNGSGLDAVYKGDGTTNLTDLRFFTSTAERIRVNENGKVSIGTQVPDGLNPEKLLVDAGPTGSYNVISGKGEIDSYLQLNIQNKSSGNVASSDLVATADNGDETNNYVDLGINSSAYSAGLAPIMNTINQPYLYTTGNDFVIGNGTAAQDLIFFNAGSLGYAVTSARMRIASTGNVGIGAVTVPAEKLTVAGIMSPASDNTYTLGTSDYRWSEVWAANGVVQTSDVHMKTNIVPLDYGLRELMKLKPVSYNWKTDPDGKRKVGLIAQETQQMIPEVVSGDASKQKLGMNYAELVAVLIHSLQQQQQKLNDLRSELNTLIK